MGFFDEQVRQRKKNDDELFRNSVDKIYSDVLGESKSTIRSGKNSIITAVNEVLSYFHCKKVSIPAEMTEATEIINYAADQAGMMTCRTRLTGKWHLDSLGPMIGFLKGDSVPVALYPMGFARYSYVNPYTGKKTAITGKEAEKFEELAFAFYNPLPLKKMSLTDLAGYMKSRLSYHDYASYIAVTVLLTLVGISLPLFSYSLTGTVVENSNYAMYAGMSVALITAVLMQNVLNAVSDIVAQKMSWKVTIPVEQAVMQRILSLPASFFRKYSAGELSSRASGINSVCQLLIKDVFVGSINALFSVAFLFQIGTLAPALVLPAVIVIASTVALNLITAKMQMEVSRQHMKHTAEERGIEYAIICGMQKIRLSGSEKRVFAKWAEHYAEGAALEYNPPLFLKINGALSTAVTLLGTVFLYAVAVANGISKAAYYSFNISYGLILGAFMALTQVAMSVADIRPVLELAGPILSEAPEKAGQKQIVRRVSGSIELNRVFFRYDASMPYVLKDFSLRIKAGEYLAVVGKSGCGKSTLVRLLLGFEKPEKGAVFYDGRDIERVDLRSLRRRIGAVVQDGQLFYGDIYHNIAIASDYLTEEEAWEAAEIAGIADDIRNMPMGMNTIITEGNGIISGGQKQRLLIARAIASKPKILIFDEATSALDNITQKQISDALDELKCTRIVIAHRLSTIKNCDRIIVIDDGKIAEEGTYDSLMNNKGAFYELVKRQEL